MSVEFQLVSGSFLSQHLNEWIFSVKIFVVNKKKSGVFDYIIVWVIFFLKEKKRPIKNLT